MELSQAEHFAFHQHLRSADLERADAFGSVELARNAWRDHALTAVGCTRAQELILQIHAIDETALLFFGFSDNTSRSITLHRAGTTAAADADPASDVAPLVRRLFESVHGLLVVIGCSEGDMINAYDIESNRFVQAAQRTIRVVVVVNQHAIYFDPQRAQECFECDYASIGHLPRLVGSSYSAWPLPFNSTEQE